MFIPPEKRKLSIYLLLVLIFLIIGITTGGNIYLTAKIADIKKGTQDNLASVAYLKVARIRTWWEERLGDASTIFNDHPMVLLLQEFLVDKTGERNNHITKEILVWMDAFQKTANYRDIMLLDANGSVKLAIDYKDKKICSASQQFILEALRTKKITATDIYRCDVHNAVDIDILIPLLAAEGDNAKPVGLVLLRINPNQFLYPLIQYYPTPSRTAETLLVRREGDYVLYLNDLRHQKETALSLKFPLNSDGLVEAMAAKGKEGIIEEGIDYRGAKVLSVVQRIPKTSWYLIAKIDEKEAYSPVKLEVFRVSCLAFFLMAFSIVFIALVWNQQVTKFYRIRYEIEAKRVKVEDDLRKANEEWERTFNAVSDAIFIITTDQVVLKGNKAFFEMLGAGPEDVVGKKCYAAINKFNKPLHSCLLKDTKLDSRPHTEEVEVSETGLFLLISTSPIFDDKGKLVAAVHVARDITERKRIEKDLQEAKEKLEKTNKELTKLDQLKSGFIATVSHELRTPLAIIKEGISLILDKIPGEINEKQLKILDVSLHNIDRLARIINSLLDISKIEAGKVELKKVFVSISDTISHAASVFENTIKQKGLELRLDIDKDTEKVYADADRITQVVTNLLDNAIKFTDKGYIEISCKNKKDFIECSVADTGVGISKENLPKVFDKFQQFGRVAGAGEKGTGLGLSIAKNIIDMHNGSMSVESELGKGTKFTFKLHKYTSEELFDKSVKDAIENAAQNGLKMSIVMIASETSKAAGGEVPARKMHDILSEAVRLVKHNLNHVGDDIIRNDGDILVILKDCSKQNSLKVKSRIEEIMRKYLSDNEMSGIIKLWFGCAAYPDDAADEMNLVLKAKNALYSSKKA